jgi:hypothetical protein
MQAVNADQEYVFDLILFEKVIVRDDAGGRPQEQACTDGSAEERADHRFLP